MGASKKTNNDALMIQAKVSLRIDSLPDKKEIKVLEAFGGEGVLWEKVKKQVPDKTFKILSIDKNQYQRVQLQGDNIKYMAGMNLQEFDIIDLDAWGSPVKQLELLFQKRYNGVVHCTFIQTMQGNLPHILLFAQGYTPNMLKKITSIFVRDGLKKFQNYLQTRGVKKIWVISKTQKNYLWFHLNSE